MRYKGTFFVYLVLIVAMVIVIVASLRMDQFASKLMPLVMGALTLIMAAVGLWGEMQKRNQPAVAARPDDTGSGELIDASWTRELLNLAWVLGFSVGIFLFGFIIAIPIFLLSYMKWLGIRWSVSLVFSVLTTGVSYYLFQVAMSVDFYPGVILTWLGR